MGEYVVDLKSLAFLVIFVLLAIVLIYLAFLFRNLVKTVKHANNILTDVENMTSIANKRTEEVDELVGDVSVSFRKLIEILKGNQSLAKAGVILVNVFGSIKTFVDRFKNEEAVEEEVEIEITEEKE